MNPLGFRAVRLANVHELASLGLYDAEDVYAERFGWTIENFRLKVVEGRDGLGRRTGKGMAVGSSLGPKAGN
ncbi:hypothetical protein E2C01_023040 [Portunus trituberculatus]|uniref:Uncharacterized protein n=1 Tax=Portunus trituberculatus TaxID=210409 RepID=A0A5B7E701_PORTR|nr:hypothetical protein [Portunus trituberculatus]